VPDDSGSGVAMKPARFDPPRQPMLQMSLASGHLRSGRTFLVSSVDLFAIV
jgi:hypothetical protein